MKNYKLFEEHNDDYVNLIIRTYSPSNEYIEEDTHAKWLYEQLSRFNCDKTLLVESKDGVTFTTTIISLDDLITLIRHNKYVQAVGDYIDAEIVFCAQYDGVLIGIPIECKDYFPNIEAMAFTEF